MNIDIFKLQILQESINNKTGINGIILYTDGYKPTKLLELFFNLNLAVNLTEVLQTLRKTNKKITYQWIKVHSDSLKNNAADDSAKKGTHKEVVSWDTRLITLIPFNNDNMDQKCNYAT